MRLQDINAINNMRLKGYSVSTISKVLELPYSTVKSHIHRHPEIPGASVCLQCGKPVKQPTGRREKKFCSDKCRMAYWNSNQDKVNKQAYYNLVCQQCGKGFVTYGNKNRKYCCRACYLDSRKRG
jgi:endogenous inhibitor of DNA gyrase (YacG/DUF329 family)